MLVTPQKQNIKQRKSKPSKHYSIGGILFHYFCISQNAIQIFFLHRVKYATNPISFLSQISLYAKAEE